jgi:predicted nucleic acid-binding protein
VTIYLPDENVLRELHAGGNVSVQAWFATVCTDYRRISTMTRFEKRRGAERCASRSPQRRVRIVPRLF